MLYIPHKLLLIAGPCSLENEIVCREVAETLTRLGAAHPELQIVFKGSFDKANRTALSNSRGPRLEKGVFLLKTVKEAYRLPVLTDIHEPAQAEPATEVCDILQIPAFLCRQTDLLAAAARTGAVVNVKKGQFLSPAEMRFVVEKLEALGASEIWQTERGTTFGYQNLVVDMRAFTVMNRYGHPTIFDATHSVQLPGAGSNGTTGGQREFVPPLAAAALAAGAKGLFVETHPNPEYALSDGPSQIPLKDFPAFVDRCLAVWKAVEKTNS